MINNITMNMTFLMLGPLNSSLAMCETDCQLIGGDGQLIGGDGQLIGCAGQLTACYGQLIACDGQLTTVYSNIWGSVFQLIISLMAGLRGKPSPAATGRCLHPAPPQLSRSLTSASVSEKGSHLKEKFEFYGPPTVLKLLYRGCHSHLGLKF